MKVKMTQYNYLEIIDAWANNRHLKEVGVYNISDISECLMQEYAFRKNILLKIEILKENSRYGEVSYQEHLSDFSEQES